jgi:predicted alpha/beta hydrolase
MQASSDVFLGWTDVVGGDGVTRDYYFRQLRDWKGSANVETMDPNSLVVYARLCGQALARAHARAGDRVAIASYLGSGSSFDTAIGEFAERYADQNERDYEALLAAEAEGRIEVRRGL